jgi:hypothetical protein
VACGGVGVGRRGRPCFAAAVAATAMPLSRGKPREVARRLRSCWIRPDCQLVGRRPREKFPSESCVADVIVG